MKPPRIEAPLSVPLPPLHRMLSGTPSEGSGFVACSSRAPESKSDETEKGCGYSLPIVTSKPGVPRPPTSVAFSLLAMCPPQEPVVISQANASPQLDIVGDDGAKFPNPHGLSGSDPEYRGHLECVHERSVYADDGDADVSRKDERVGALAPRSPCDFRGAIYSANTHAVDIRMARILDLHFDTTTRGQSRPPSDGRARRGEKYGEKRASDAVQHAIPHSGKRLRPACAWPAFQPSAWTRHWKARAQLADDEPSPVLAAR